MKPDLTKAEEHPCTFPSREQHTKSICHQTCRGLRRVIHKPATQRFSADPHCIISGKAEAQVLSSGGRLWPGEGVRYQSTHSMRGHRHRRRFVSQLKQRGGESLQTPLEVACAVSFALQESLLAEVMHFTSPLTSAALPSFPSDVSLSR